MVSFCYFLFCACFFVVSANVLRNDLYRLDIVHYNDFHDRFEETSIAFPICKSNDTTCVGGFARLYHEIQVLVEEHPDALVLNAGDNFQGTYWYTLMKWNVTQKFINMIPNDVHALGNHEFDDGVPGLAPFIKALKAPVVAANLITSKDSELYSTYKPHVIVQKNGKKIGVIGLITQRTQKISKADEVTFLDPIPVVEKEAKLLTDQGVDIIVVLSHCGLDVDQEIAKQVGQNIDVIVGGHTHSLLWNGEAPSKEYVSGPYPVLVESEAKPGHKVLIVTASAFSKYLGNMSVFFDDKGDLQHFEGTPVYLNRSIPEDPKIKALLQPYADELHKVVREVVGYSKDVLKMDPCGSKECELGNLIADAIMDGANEMYPSKLPCISFLQRNMIRASMPKGDITRGAIINMSPFTNHVVTLVVPGRYILTALQKSVEHPWRAHPYVGPYTPMISGIKLTMNTTSGEVMEALVTSGGEAKQLNPDEEYQFITMDFITNVAYKDLKKYGRNLKLVGKDADIVEAYIRKSSPITPYLDNRLTLLS
ncbi:apyrase-like isoform X2 [Anticarsia gemmatalis]|uniref:apyrase-like isoform X2 n=1 Tax=Anticarsia gemmatalis TaxID=129554 RepID=UPI003F760C5B